MGCRKLRSIVLSFLFLLILGASLGCDDLLMESTFFSRFSKLSQLWPNQDGMQWSYLYTIRSWEQEPWTVYDDPADVPPVPSMREVMRLLVTNPIGEDISRQEFTFQMTFQGEITTGPGVTAQNLVEYIYLGSEESAPITASGHSEAFLLRFAAARPDLRERIIPHLSPEAAAALGEPGELVPNSERVARGPILIHGGAWEKTAQYIGTYGDVDDLLAWKFLTQRARAGVAFTHQLIPSLANDVFLHALVLGKVNVGTESGSFKNALRVLYLIDYGISEPFGLDDPGYWRVFDYGYVDYVPNVGPVASYERNLVSVGDPDSKGVGDQTLDLMKTNMTEVK